MQVECFPDAPPEWERKTVHEVARVSPRYRLKKDQEYPFVEMAAVAENFGGITRFGFRRADASGLARFRENDILFGKITPCAENGKVALVKGLPGEYGLGSTEFIVLSPREGNDPRFIYALVCASSVHGRAVTRMEGSTGRQRITEDTFTKLLRVPVPLFDEQVAIADTLDGVDEAIKRTRTTLEKARRLKEGILQKAFSRDLARVEKLKDFVTDIRYGTSQASNDKRWGYPTLRIPNIIGGTINASDLTYVDATTADAKRYLLKEDDILLVRTNGNPAYIGRSAVFSPPDEKEWLYASYLIRVRFNDNLYARYIDEYLKSERGRRELMKRVTTSAGNYNINTKSILTIPFPYQDETTQAETIALTEAANVQISRFENELTALEKLKKGLMQDLLTGKVRVKQLAIAESASD